MLKKYTITSRNPSGSEGPSVQIEAASFADAAAQAAQFNTVMGVDITGVKETMTRKAKAK